MLDARRIGHGGSGRNVGLVNAGLWLPPQDVRARLGEARGAAFTASCTIPADPASTARGLAKASEEARQELVVLQLGASGAI